MAVRSANRWGLFAVACAAALALGGAAPADELLRLPARSPNGVKQPIRLAADEGVEFTEGKYRYTRLLGTVFIDRARRTATDGAPAAAQRTVSPTSRGRWGFFVGPDPTSPTCADAPVAVSTPPRARRARIPIRTPRAPARS